MDKAWMLMSADRPLLKFVPGTAQIRLLEEDPRPLPPPLRTGAPDAGRLDRWLKTRLSPLGERLLSGRQELPQGPLGVLEKTLGLSLNDVWWISDGSMAWEDVRLYGRKPDEAAAGAALAGVPLASSEDIRRSPEWSTQGDMAKCWLLEDGRMLLAKRDEPDGNGLCQAVKEWFAWQAAEAMGLDCVPYDLRPLDGDPLSPACVCPSFADEGTGFLSAAVFLRSCGAWTGQAGLLCAPRMHDPIAEAMGTEFYEDMMVFDALIGNADRHLGNFGMLFDAATGEILRPAPLFDNGMSFEDCGCRWMSRELQLESFLRPRHEAMLEAAARLELKPHPVVPVTARAIEAMQNFARSSAEDALMMLQKRRPRTS